MKKITLLIFLFLCASIQAQFNQRRGAGLTRPQMNTQPQPRKAPEFNGEKAAGITIYDIEKTTKKIGIKPPAKNYKQIPL